MPRTEVFDNPYQIDKHINIGGIQDELQQLAVERMGACTKKFKQGSEEMEKGLGWAYHLMLRNGKKWGGVCKALCMYWIGYHATDKDFWGWLFDEKNKAQINTAVNIISTHNSYYNRDGSKEDWAKKFLSRYRVIPQKGVKGNPVPPITGNAGPVKAKENDETKQRQAGAALAAQIAPLKRTALNEGYRQLSIGGGGDRNDPKQGGRHAVVAWVAEDVLFFDPNHGEYWFERTDMFRQWFMEYWLLTRYAKRYQGEYKILTYQKLFTFR